MATQNYLQIGSDRIIKITTFGSIALIDNGYNVDAFTYIEDKGLLIKSDYFFIKTQGILISSLGEIFRLYGGEQPPTELSYLLTEESDFMLLEDDSKILLQR